MAEGCRALVGRGGFVGREGDSGCPWPPCGGSITRLLKRGCSAYSNLLGCVAVWPIATQVSRSSSVERMKHTAPARESGVVCLFLLAQIRHRAAAVQYDCCRVGVFSFDTEDCSNVVSTFRADTAAPLPRQAGPCPNRRPQGCCLRPLSSTFFFFRSPVGPSSWWVWGTGCWSPTTFLRPTPCSWWPDCG